MRIFLALVSVMNCKKGWWADMRNKVSEKITKTKESVKAWAEKTSEEMK